MSRKTFWIVFIALGALILTLVWMTFSDAEDHAWTVCYEMTNKNVEWTGAGYNGLNAK